MSDPLASANPTDPASGASANLPPSPPQAGAAKQAVVSAIEGASLISIGASAIAYGAKYTLQQTGKLALSGLIGTTAKQIVGFNVPFLFGPFNEAVEHISANLTGNADLPTIDRPFFDLEGPGRSLINLLSFLPITADAAQRKSAEITARDFQPQVDELIATAQAVATSTSLFPSEKVYHLTNIQNEIAGFIKAGAARDPLVNLFAGIELTKQHLQISLPKPGPRFDGGNPVESVGTDKRPPDAGQVVGVDKLGLPILSPARGDP